VFAGDVKPPNSVMTRRWRVGRSLGRTIYEQVGPSPSKDDKYLGMMETKAIADHVIALHNASIERVT
jgi:hypothetical protein